MRDGAETAWKASRTRIDWTYVCYSDTSVADSKVQWDFTDSRAQGYPSATVWGKIEAEEVGVSESYVDLLSRMMEVPLKNHFYAVFWDVLQPKPYCNLDIICLTTCHVLSFCDKGFERCCFEYPSKFCMAEMSGLSPHKTWGSQAWKMKRAQKGKKKPSSQWNGMTVYNVCDTNIMQVLKSPRHEKQLPLLVGHCLVLGCPVLELDSTV